MIFFRKNKIDFKNNKINIVRKKVTSGGSRSSFVFKKKLPFFEKIKKFRITIKSNSGRSNNSGRTIIFSKKSSTKKAILKINYSFRFSLLGFIGAIMVMPRTHKVLSILFLSSGGISYIQSSYSHHLFNIVKMNNLFEDRLQLIYNYRFFKIFEKIIFMISQLPRNKKISLLEVKPGSGIKYIRSPGSFGFLHRMDLRTTKAYIKLPSGAKKFFSTYSLGSLNPNPIIENRYFLINKAGFFSKKGKKPKVRGVAKNPVDHPHGGRTKSISYQRTPWGKTTKYK